MSRLSFLVATHLIRLMPATRLFGWKRRLLRWGGVSVGEGSRVHSQAHLDTAYVSIGQDTWIGGGVFIGGNPGAPVTIGDRVDLAPRVMIITGTHDVGTTDRRAGPGRAEAVSVGDGTWVGAGALILPGVVIGRGCVVAAGSVVTADVPDNTLVGGVPARRLKDL